MRRSTWRYTGFSPFVLAFAALAEAETAGRPAEPRDAAKPPGGGVVVAAGSVPATANADTAVADSSARRRAARPAFPPTSSLFAEVLAARDEERAALAALRAEMAATADARAALEVQRRVERLKRDTELRLLRIQAAWAVREGRTDAARAIERAIEEAAAPRPAGQPLTRPAPAAAARR